tara:strand:+ start:514 stop:945 length:432 start_codon:yes stop_codon:yes gene_type:complete
MKIAGLKIFQNKIIKNSKGDILKFVSTKNVFFKRFGEIYFSEIKKNKTKGWNFHKKNTCLLVVPYGEVKFSFVDGRKKSKTHNKKVTIKLSKKKYKIVSVPPKVWFSFYSLSRISLVANLIEKPHSDRETLKSKKVKNILIPE